MFAARGVHQLQTLIRKISMMTKNLIKIQKCFLRFQNIFWKSQNIDHGLELFFQSIKNIFKIPKYFPWSTIVFQSLKIFLMVNNYFSESRDFAIFWQRAVWGPYLSIWRGIRCNVFPKIDREKTFFSCSMFLFHLCNRFHKDKEFHPIG